MSVVDIKLNVHDNEDEEDQYAPVEESIYEKIYMYGLFIWDGLNFFGFATSKLGRLKGQKVNYCTQFTNLQWVLMTLLGLIVAIVILASELSTLNTQKSVTISLVGK